MGLRSAIAAHLKADSAVSARVGTAVFLGLAPPVDRPYVTIHVIGGDHTRHMGGGSGLALATVQIDAWADTPTEAESLATEIREAMDNFNRGTLGSGANTATTVGTFLDSEFDDQDFGDAGDQSGFYATRQTWRFWHTETVTP